MDMPPSPATSPRGGSSHTPADLDGALTTFAERAGRWLRDLGQADAAPLLEVPDVGPTCEVLLADQLVHDLSDEERRGLLAFVRAEQDPETGGWCDASGEPDLSLTVLGWWARAQYGDDPAAPDMTRARRLIHRLGGAQRANFQVRLWLALAGAAPWSWLPAIPAELWLAPHMSPLSPTRMSPWARDVLAAYLLAAHEPARIHLIDPSSLLAVRDEAQVVPPRLTRPGLAGDLLQAFDRGVKLARKMPRGPMRDIALSRARTWLDRGQQHNGGWFGVRPTLIAVIALRAEGAASDDARVRAALDYLRRCRGRVPSDDDTRPHLAQGLCAPPVRALAGLAQAARDGDAWDDLLRQEIAEPGPWQLAADLPIGGWPREQDGNRHVDLEATCAALDALAQVPDSDALVERAWAASRRALPVVFGMQEPDGTFARFERGETRPPLRALPWQDARLLAHGAQGDGPHIRLTALALAALGRAGFRLDDDRVRRGVAALERALAEPADTPTLAAAARAAAHTCPASHPFRQEMEQRLRARQAEDGSYGHDVADTARALRALVALTTRPCVQARRAAAWLVAHAEDAPRPSPCDGIGLSPTLHDRTAADREATSALRAYAGAGGTLDEEGAR